MNLLLGGFLGLLFFRFFSFLRSCFFRSRILSGIFTRVSRGGIFFVGGGFIFFAAVVAAVTATASTGGFLAGVVGYIPSGTFELDGGSGNLRFDFAAAVRTFFEMRAVDGLDFLAESMALPAFVFVQGHRHLLTKVRTGEYITRGILASRRVLDSSA